MAKKFIRHLEFYGFPDQNTYVSDINGCCNVDLSEIIKKNKEQDEEIQDLSDEKANQKDLLELSGTVESMIDIQSEINQEFAEAISGHTQRLDDITDKVNEISDAVNDAICGIQNLGDKVDDVVGDLTELSGKVETLSGEVIDLREDLEKEIEERIEADEILQQEIEEVDGQLIDWSQNPFTLSAATLDGDYNLVLPSKDKNDEHSIKIMFD